MKKIFIILLLPFVLFAKGKIGIISDLDGAYIYVDDKKITVVGKGYTDIKVQEGERFIRIEKLSDDGKWRYVGEKKVFVGTDTYTKVKIDTQKHPTHKRKQKLAKKKIDKKEKKQRAWALLKASFVSSGDGRYYRSNQGVVYDKKVQLLWQDSDSVRHMKKSWNGAKEYCSDLNLTGFDDWRMPSQEELRSIVDFSRYNPAIKKVFKNVKSDYYWSSTSVSSDLSDAWSVGFEYGGDNAYAKSNSLFVRCVRE